jgi:glutathione synthase/RimK-type ligase-like ATP-grasp enzyme
MLGIHDRPGSFSDRWIKICEERKIPFRRINCLASDIIQLCADIDAVLWHWSHTDPSSQLLARQIIISLEESGVLVFPNSKTCWHFDDKLGQKFLLEAARAPLIPTWIFTDKATAMNWIQSATWPKVFKLRRGAGSANVHLVHSRSQAETFCGRAFGRGFPAVAGYFSDIETRARRTRSAGELLGKITRAPRTLLHILAAQKNMQQEQGYVYFQEFLPNNVFDTRVTIIGDRAFAYRRMNRPNDFRASGSGNPSYDSAQIDRRCVDTAFKVASRLGTQSLAFDFLFNADKGVMISEVSYCYVASMVHACSGQWDSHSVWHAGHVWPEEAILVDVLVACNR